MNKAAKLRRKIAAEVDKQVASLAFVERVFIRRRWVIIKLHPVNLRIKRSVGWPHLEPMVIHGLCLALSVNSRSIETWAATQTIQALSTGHHHPHMGIKLKAICLDLNIHKLLHKGLYREAVIDFLGAISQTDPYHLLREMKRTELRKHDKEYR